MIDYIIDIKMFKKLLFEIKIGLIQHVNPLKTFILLVYGWYFSISKI